MFKVFDYARNKCRSLLSTIFHRVKSAALLMEYMKVAYHIDTDGKLCSSQDKDGEASDGSCLGTDKEIITAQSLTIVEEDGSLGSGEDQAAVAELAHTQGLLDAGDDDVQYQFRSGEGGTVTYRVVQVGGGGDAVDPLPQIVSTSPGFSTGSAGVQQGVQAVLTSPINGQFYVIGSPQDVFGTQNPRSLAPRAGIQIETSRGGISRDDRRRATHNEVERRRRDKINNWIVKLSKIIPDCTAESAKTGQVGDARSKGGILAKACEYIVELRSSNQRLAECLKDNERLTMDIEMIRQQNEELKRDNSLLRAQLSQHGIIPPPDLSNPTVS
ncbi:upstream stimulatory factor 1 isoform X2 [Cryptotermes secundus]|uniref:upstream stimulatory factor 1 isoform X2 n=1 Tax=Cryptotermes secundus TaxID=105785 RepID=UPI000CD7D5BF|nr:upstream stimulatory factor 1 isoform X2 [Cryptotermes secundus]